MHLLLDNAAFLGSPAAAFFSDETTLGLELATRCVPLRCRLVPGCTARLFSSREPAGFLVSLPLRGLGGTSLVFLLRLLRPAARILLGFSRGLGPLPRLLGGAALSLLAQGRFARTGFGILLDPVLDGETGRQAFFQRLTDAVDFSGGVGVTRDTQMLIFH
ncbi:MAG: hypothetical protein AB7G35_18240, partial [Hyphomicrobiaceae bacterium]